MITILYARRCNGIRHDGQVRPPRVGVPRHRRGRLATRSRVTRVRTRTAKRNRLRSRTARRFVIFGRRLENGLFTAITPQTALYRSVNVPDAYLHCTGR